MNNDFVRIGKVTAIDAGTMKVRVQFPDTDIISDWLPVLRHKSPAGNTGTSSGHTHSVTLGHWMPQTGDTVLCLYLPGFNSDGYVLGGIS